MFKAYMREVSVLALCYAVFFVLAYTPIGKTITGSNMPLWLLETKLIILGIAGLSLIARSMLRMRRHGKELGRPAWPFNLLTIFVGLFLLHATPLIALSIGVGY